MDRFEPPYRCPADEPPARRDVRGRVRQLDDGWWPVDEGELADRVMLLHSELASFPCEREFSVQLDAEGRPYGLLVDGTAYRCTPAPGLRFLETKGHQFRTLTWHVRGPVRKLRGAVDATSNIEVQS